MFKYPSILSPNDRNRFMLICETEEDNEPVLFKNVTLASELDKRFIGPEGFYYLYGNTIIAKAKSGNCYRIDLSSIVD